MNTNEEERNVLVKLSHPHGPNKVYNCLKYEEMLIFREVDVITKVNKITVGNPYAW